MLAPARTRIQNQTIVWQIIACTFFAALVAVFARIAIYVPFTPIPFTLQPMAVMLTGLLLGPKLGFLALLEYVVAGALGAPVFSAGNGGWLYVSTTPTLGYLISYPLAAGLAGLIATRGLKPSFGRYLLAGIACLAVVYLGGNSYLSFWLGRGALDTLLLGAAPFILADLAKAVIAAGVVRSGSGSVFAWGAGSKLS